MKLILQVSTGGFTQSSIQDIEKMEAQLQELLQRLPVSRIIFGWGLHPDATQSILALAHRHQKQALLWLPVFADIEHPDIADPLQALGPQQQNHVKTCSGEEFHFMCPNSEKNLDLVMSSFEHVLGNNAADGVFLDRIRYPSAVFSHYDFFGCYCSRCLELYREVGIHTKRFCNKASVASDLHSFIPSSLVKGCYHYEDRDFERLCEIKRRSVLQAVQKLTYEFHRLGMVVGLDTFAPALADLVGQDLHRLADVVDFIKPMMYYQTTAPAGISYELNAYGEQFSRKIADLWGLDIGCSSSMKEQLQSIRGKAQICPGIEVNQVPGICDPKETDFSNTLRTLSETECEEVVLSWNVLHAPEKNIRSIEQVLLQLNR